MTEINICQQFVLNIIIKIHNLCFKAYYFNFYNLSDDYAAYIDRLMTITFIMYDYRL